MKLPFIARKGMCLSRCVPLFWPPGTVPEYLPEWAPPGKYSGADLSVRAAAYAAAVGGTEAGAVGPLLILVCLAPCELELMWAHTRPGLNKRKQ